MKKILVIDDDKLFCATVAATLRRQDYEVCEANSGASGLALAFNQPPSLVLCDVNMTGQDGFGVLQELRTHPETSAIPIILMTGEPLKADARFSMNSGADDYLQKPFPMEVLLTAVSARLQRRAGINLAVAAEHARTEEKMRLLTSALEAAANGIAITERNGNIIWVNHAFAKLTGYTPEEAIGQNPRVLKSGQLPSEFYAGLWADISAGKVWQGELVNKRKDGSLYCEEMTITPVRGADGAIQNYIAIKQDISHRKQSEKILRESEARFHSLFENLPEGFACCQMLFDGSRPVDFIYLQVNPAFETLTGLKNVGGKKVSTVIPDVHQTNPELLEIYGRVALTGKSEKFESYLHTLKLWFSINAYSQQLGHFVAIFDNITSRKTTEQALVQERDLLHALMDNQPDHIYFKDVHSRFTRINPSLARHLGLANPEAAIGKSDADFFPPMQARQKLVDERCLLATGKPLLGLVEKSDTVKGATWVSSTKVPIRGADGQVLGLVGISRDITADKHAEESLSRSEMKFRTLFDSTSDAVMLLDEEGFFDCNQAALRMMGCASREEFCSKHPADLSPPQQLCGGDSRPLAQTRIAAAMATGSQRFEWVHRRADTGTTFPAEVLLTTMKLDERLVIQAVVRDITERKQAEARLRESEEEFRLMAEAMPQIVWITRPDGWNIYFNQQWMDYTGLTLDQSIGHGWNKPFHPDDQRRAWDAWQHATATIGTYSLECRLRRSDGVYRWWLIRGVPVRDAHGNLLKWFGTCTDIHDLKQAERERQMIELQLRQSQKLESIGQLAAGIAHEINTPTQYVGDNTRFVKDSFAAISQVLKNHETLLAAAKANTVTPELLARSEALVADSDLEYLCEQIPSALTQTLEGVERVSRIVRAMKEFSHPGGKEKTPADLNRGIESTATVAHNEWKYVAELKLELEPNLPPIPCFLGELNQCVLNLIVNAAHAIGDVVKKNPGTKGLITVQTRRDGDQVEIRVTDTGAGIPEAVRSKIFEPFFTTKDVGKGTGQGLSMIYGSIVTRHGGTVSFETKTGAGATFIIRLPIKPPPGPVAEPPPSLEIPAA